MIIGDFGVSPFVHRVSVCVCVCARVASAVFNDLGLSLRAAGKVFNDVGAGGYSITADYITVQGLVV